MNAKKIDSWTEQHSTQQQKQNWFLNRTTFYSTLQNNMVNYCYTFDDYKHFNTAFLKMKKFMKRKNYIHNPINICMPYAITQRGEEFCKKLPYLEIGGINSQNGEGETKWTLSIRKITHLTEQKQDEIQEYFDKIILETRENKNMLDIDPKLLFVLNFNKNITDDLVIGDYDKDEFVIVDKEMKGTRIRYKVVIE